VERDLLSLYDAEREDFTMQMRVLGGVAALALGASVARGQIEFGPDFEGPYSAVTLGQPEGVPTNFGGLTFLPSNPNVLLLGGGANTASGAIYAVNLVRNLAGRVTGFSGTATLYATAPNIDGGLTFGPNGVLFATTYSDNTMHQYTPGATTPSSTTDLTALGVTGSTGTCQFVPEGFVGAGSLVVASYSPGVWYRVPLTASGALFTLGDATEIASTGGGPEGIVYINDDNPGFPRQSVLMSAFGLSKIVAFELDATGAPIPSTQRDFITGLGGAEGAAIDPVSGDFFFSTFGGTGVVRVSGFRAPGGCDSIDFNRDGLFPDSLDLDDFIAVLGGGPTTCSSYPVPGCRDLDYNNDGLFPDSVDLDAIISVISGGPCLR
jgi:hypothetical protein